MHQITYTIIIPYHVIERIEHTQQAALRKGGVYAVMQESYRKELLSHPSIHSVSFNGKRSGSGCPLMLTIEKGADIDQLHTIVDNLTKALPNKLNKAEVIPKAQAINMLENIDEACPQRNPLMKTA